MHAECDEPNIDLEVIKHNKVPLDYMCPVCKNRDSSDLELGNFQDIGAMIDDGSLQDIENFEIFKSLKGRQPLPSSCPCSIY